MHVALEFLGRRHVDRIGLDSLFRIERPGAVQSELGFVFDLIRVGVGVVVGQPRALFEQVVERPADRQQVPRAGFVRERLEETLPSGHAVAQIPAAEFGGVVDGAEDQRGESRVRAEHRNFPEIRASAAGLDDDREADRAVGVAVFGFGLRDDFRGSFHVLEAADLRHDDAVDLVAEFGD